MSDNTVKIPLWQPTWWENERRWKLVRCREGGGMEVLEMPFELEASAKVMAATINAELVQIYQKTLRDMLSKRLGLS